MKTDCSHRHLSVSIYMSILVVSIFAVVPLSKSVQRMNVSALKDRERPQKWPCHSSPKANHNLENLTTFAISNTNMTVMFHGYVGFKNDKDFTTEGFFTKMGASTGSVGINGLRYSILCCGIGIPLCEYLVSLCGFPFHYVVFRFRMNAVYVCNR